jgi:hypothetical protein
MNTPNPLTNREGAALPVALLFAIVAGITVLIYILSQYSLSRPDLQSAMTFQARLTARSGIWHGLALLNTQTNEDGEQEDSTELEDEFWGFEDLAAQDDGAWSVDTTRTLVVDQPLEVNPFIVPGSGRCLLTLSAAGLMRLLDSRGTYREKTKTVAVLLGSRPLTNPDTVLYLQTPQRPHGSGLVDGDLGLVPVEVDSIAQDRRHRFTVCGPELKEYIDQHSTLLSQTLDTAFEASPLKISHNDDLNSIPELVEGTLVLDATFHDLHWSGKRTIHVLKDLQIDGDVQIEGATFIVGGEIRLGVGDFSSGDEIRLREVSLFSRSRIFFAQNVVFEGSAMALGDIEIYRNARILGKSIIASNGAPRSTPKTADAAAAKDSSAAEVPKSRFTIYVREEATVDGVLLNLDKRGGIMTEPRTAVRGILWAEGRVCHRGELEGAIKARALVSEDNPLDIQRNVMDGSVRSLDTIDDYHLPYFVGELTILEWRE